MKHTIDDVKLTIEPEFRMLHNRVGVFNSHFQNFKNFGVPRAQLIIADPPITWELMLTQVTHHGMLVATTRTEKATWQAKSFSTPTRISVLLSLCTSARKC